MKKVAFQAFPLAVAFLVASCGALPGEGPVNTLTIYDFEGGWDFFEADSSGDYWINNAHGIAQYDSSQDVWVQYTKGADFDIRSNDKGPIAVDGDDIWIGYGWANDPTGLGVTRWNRSTDTFTHYAADLGTPNMPGGPVWTIQKKDDGNIWVGTRFDYACAYFDGTSWHQFLIESGATYFDCNTIAFSTNYGFFQSYRGGLHVYDFSTSEWLHTEHGVSNGTESFMDRGFYNSCLLVQSFQDLYLSTTNNIAGGDPLADGIWHYDGTQWSNISPAAYENEEVTSALTLGPDGSLWALFHQDKRIRVWNGSSWTEWAPAGTTITEDYYFRPIHFDGEYMWLALVNDGTSTYARYKLL